jgi:hypothetical protein
LALPLADDQQYLWQLRPAVCSPDGGSLIDFNDLGVLVRGRLTGSEIQTAVTVGPDVALDVTAFIAATCRAA